jgi:outer membrane protein assembly factor BamD (BamD/ComL family)
MISYKLLNKSLILFAATVLFATACQRPAESTQQATEPPKEQYTQHIANIEKAMHKNMSINKDTAVEAIRAYNDYVVRFPNDSISADYLFKAAEIATAIGQYQQAVILYQQIKDKYSGYKLYTESFYLQAFVYDNHLNDDAKAKTLYEEMIVKFPKSVYVNDAKAAIVNLGKTDEQLIEEFKKKNNMK